MLQKYFQDIENLIIAKSKVASNSGHSLHKGNPREIFIVEFLQNHLPELVTFGTGEIISSNSLAGESRNQIDIVLYKKNYPKINYGKNTDGFFNEGVVSTIEVKSLLNKNEFFKALNSIKKIKDFEQSISSKEFFKAANTYYQPSPLSFIVAYESTAKIETIFKWLVEYIKLNNIDYSNFESKNKIQKANTKNPLVDMIVILGKGVIVFDGATDLNICPDNFRSLNPKGNWVVLNQKKDNIFLLFSFLTILFASISPNVINIYPYLQKSGVDLSHQKLL
jgi:hypothetical protein